MQALRILLWFVLFLCVPALSLAQNQPKADSPLPATSDSPKVDPAKAADIRRLLDVAGIRNAMKQVLGGSAQNMKPMLMKSFPPGEYREKLIDLFLARLQENFDVDSLLDDAIVAYDKNLTHEEIKGLIQFYQTPLGQKTISVLPKLTLELQEKGRQKGEEVGRRSMEEVLAEHPDLAAAMQAAAKANALH